MPPGYLPTAEPREILRPRTPGGRATQPFLTKYNVARGYENGYLWGKGVQNLKSASTESHGASGLPARQELDPAGIGRLTVDGKGS